MPRAFALFERRDVRHDARVTFGVLALICGLELAMIVTVVLLDWRANRPNLPVATLRRRVR